MVEVFRISDDSEESTRTVLKVDKSEYELDHTLDSSWEPATFVVPDDSKDCYRYSICTYIVSAEFKSKFEATLNGCVNWIQVPVQNRDEEFWWMRPDKQLKALDYEKSDIEFYTYEEDVGPVVEAVNSYSFHESKISNVPVFHIPEDWGNDFFVTNTFVKLFNDSGLSGLKFRKVYPLDVQPKVASVVPESEGVDIELTDVPATELKLISDHRVEAHDAGTILKQTNIEESWESTIELAALFTHLGWQLKLVDSGAAAGQKILVSPEGAYGLPISSLYESIRQGTGLLIYNMVAKEQLPPKPSKGMRLLG
jgi:hypothetical protein